MKFTLAELKLADEVCYPKDFNKIIDKYPELWILKYDFIHLYDRSLLKWLFHFNRAEQDKLQPILDEIIASLIKKD